MGGRNTATTPVCSRRMPLWRTPRQAVAVWARKRKPSCSRSARRATPSMSATSEPIRSPSPLVCAA
ncbi:Uncharacterised protein [Mycobacteroides abscessus subsp. abscessus]|nr:Uncharacterised protein [Mycobacteroides abscessus subsp. abscessus]